MIVRIHRLPDVETEKTLAAIAKMPSLPITVSKILQIANDPKTSPSDLNQVISVAPVLMGRVMTTARRRNRGGLPASGRWISRPGSPAGPGRRAGRTG